MTLGKAIQAFRKERDTPYSIPLSSDALNNSCSGKCYRLQDALKAFGIRTRRRVCRFRWDDLPLSESVKALCNDLEGVHMYLEAQIDKEWQILDPSWDSGLFGVFEIANWDGVSSTPIAVPSNGRIMSVEEGERYLNSLTQKDNEEDLEKNHGFYLAMNNELDAIRAKSSRVTLSDDGKVLFSADLAAVVSFLSLIEDEIKAGLDHQQKVNQLRLHINDQLAELSRLREVLNSNGIAYISKTPVLNSKDLVSLYQVNPAMRVQCIAIFSFLETLSCLNLAFEHRTTNKVALINLAMDSRKIKSFIKRFCLNSGNAWYSNNEKRGRRIQVKDIREMRNNLTHFFSVDARMGISSVEHRADSRLLEEKTGYTVGFLDPEELFELATSASDLVVQGWSQCYQSDPLIFAKGIAAVKRVTEEHAAVFVKKR